MTRFGLKLATVIVFVFLSRSNMIIADFGLGLKASSAFPSVATLNMVSNPRAYFNASGPIESFEPSTVPFVDAPISLQSYYLPLIMRNSSGRVYYVATTGNDTAGIGSAANPWRTIAKGVSVLKPSDILYVKSGTYLQTSELNISRSGTATARITISTAPGEPSLAIISGDTNGNGTADPTDAPAPTGYHLVALTGSYIDFRNLEVAFSGKHGVSSYGSSNIIAGNRVHNIWGAGIWAWAPNNIIENNVVWRAADSNYCGGVGGSRGCNGDWGAGIAWGDTSAPYDKSPNSIIRHNTVFNTSGEGVLCMQTDGGLVEDNVVYDNWALNIYLDQCSNTTVQRNLIYYTGDKSWWRRSFAPTSNIGLSNEGISGYASIGHDRKIINNILVGGGESFDFWQGWASGSALINDVIANNTIVEPQGGTPAIRIDPPAPGASHVNTRLTNNLILQSNGQMAYVATTVGLTFDHNLWSQTPPLNVSSPTDVIGNPLLADPAHQRLPGAVVPDWYKLTLGSPAIDKAIPLSSVMDDYFGAARGTLPDIGAHEYP